jgi:hypothetical protein
MRTKRTCALLAVMATLLLTGCRSGCEQDGITRPEKSSLGRVIDSPALTGTPSQRGKDSLREYYERMERWEMLHGGMSRWESDK